ncbi:MAG: acyltransferase [Clostridia bacterium]|nr:acyltransferase [Clostridia bacterium]
MNIENKDLNRRDDYLSLKNTICLKGILAICIILCHLWGAIVEGKPSLGDGVIGNTVGRICTVLGYLSVALFFFISGYGLCVQSEKKGDTYLNGFLLKRVLPLYIINILLIIFYALFNLLLEGMFSWKIVLQSFFFGGTIISKGWYLQAILVWYLFFFIVFKFIKSNKLQIVAMIGAFLVYLTACLIMQLSSTWYEGVFCLILGIVWAKYFKQISEILSKNKWFILSILIVGLLFAVSFVFGNFSFLSPPIRVAVKSISACMFTIFVVLFLRIVPINNIVTLFLGKISLEIYVFHGFFLMLYRCKHIYINNWILYSVLVIASTILLAWMIYPLFSMILKLGKKEKKNGNEH